MQIRCSHFGGLGGELEEQNQLVSIIEREGPGPILLKFFRTSYLETPKTGRQRDLRLSTPLSGRGSPSLLFGASSMSPRGLASVLDLPASGPHGGAAKAGRREEGNIT